MNAQIQNSQWFSDETNSALMAELRITADWLQPVILDCTQIRLQALDDDTFHVVLDFSGRQFESECIAERLSREELSVFLLGLRAVARHSNR